MFANLKYLPKRFNSWYILYKTGLLLTFIALALIRPDIKLILPIFVFFFMIDCFLLFKSEEKILLPLLVDLFIYLCWLIILYPF